MSVCLSAHLKKQRIDEKVSAQILFIVFWPRQFVEEEFIAPCYFVLISVAQTRRLGDSIMVRYRVSIISVPWLKSDENQREVRV